MRQKAHRLALAEESVRLYVAVSSWRCVKNHTVGIYECVFECIGVVVQRPRAVVKRWAKRCPESCVPRPQLMPNYILLCLFSCFLPFYLCLERKWETMLSVLDKLFLPSKVVMFMYNGGFLGLTGFKNFVSFKLDTKSSSRRDSCRAMSRR